jgi:erythromycin esterase
VTVLDRFLPPIEERRQEDLRRLQAWLRSHGRPMVGSHAALGVLAQRLAQAEVIGLGEVTHGSQEDMAFKAALLRSLVEEQGLGLLALEANRAVGLRLQRFIAPGSTETDVQAALRESGIFSFYRCEVVGELLQWLQTWNRTASHPVRIIGIDVQDPSRDLKAGLATLQHLDPELAQRLTPPLEELLREQVPPVAELFPHANRAQWQRWVGGAQALESALRRLQADEDTLDAVYAARMALYTFEFDVGTAGAPADLPPDAFTRRDVAMAERLLHARHAGERAALWAHDAHVASNSYDAFGPQAPTVGKVLRERLGPDGYQSLNFSYRQATFHAHGLSADGSIDRKGPLRQWRITSAPGSLGATLAASGLHSFWLDLDELPPDRWALQFRLEPWRRGAFGDGVAPDQLAAGDVGWPLGYGTDILVHLDTLTPSHLYLAVASPAAETRTPAAP